MSASDGIFVLGNYKLIEVLGIGAMGYVYRARQLNLERDVAVKILSPKLAQETNYLDLFFREARTAASLEHPHIVPVFDYGIQQNVSYVAMRLLLGGSLGERIQFRLDRKLVLPSLPEVMAVLTQAASALDYAHARGVIHRDIKPTNLMFDQHGVVYIVDFGIAKLIGTTSSVNGGTFLGTPSFMAPEQWEGLAPTPAVDQYALGAVIYMMLTGHAPFESETPLALMSKHLNAIPLDVQEYRPNLPAPINGVLQKAMAKQPTDRYPTTMAFAQAVAAVIQDSASEKQTEFTTYSLPHSSFSLPFPTPIGLPAITTPLVTQTMPEGGSTLRLPTGRGRNIVLWVESVLLILAVVLIVLLLIQRSSIDTPALTPTSVAALVVTQDASPLLVDDPGSPTAENNALLSPSATFTPTFTPTFLPTETLTTVPLLLANTATSAPTDLPTFNVVPSDTPTFTPSATFTSTDAPTFTPSATFTATDAPSATSTPSETPTETPSPTVTLIAPRPTVNWHLGSHLRINNSSGAWLRSRPSTRGAQVATLAYNNLVTATGNKLYDGRQWWWEVTASWGAVGWVEQYSLVEQ